MVIGVVNSWRYYISFAVPRLSNSTGAGYCG